METIETAVSATNTGAEMIAMNAPNAADKQQQSNDEDEDEDEETAAAIVRPSVSIDESEIIVTDGRDDNETAMMMHHQEMLNGSDIITNLTQNATLSMNSILTERQPSILSVLTDNTGGSQACVVLANKSISSIVTADEESDDGNYVIESRQPTSGKDDEIEQTLSFIANTAEEETFQPVEKTDKEELNDEQKRPMMISETAKSEAANKEPGDKLFDLLASATDDAATAISAATEKLKMKLTDEVNDLNISSKSKKKTLTDDELEAAKVHVEKLQLLLCADTDTTHADVGFTNKTDDLISRVMNHWTTAMTMIICGSGTMDEDIKATLCKKSRGGKLMTTKQKNEDGDGDDVSATSDETSSVVSTSGLEEDDMLAKIAEEAVVELGESAIKSMSNGYNLISKVAEATIFHQNVAELESDISELEKRMLREEKTVVKILELAAQHDTVKAIEKGMTQGVLADADTMLEDLEDGDNKKRGLARRTGSLLFSKKGSKAHQKAVPEDDVTDALSQAPSSTTHSMTRSQTSSRYSKKSSSSKKLGLLRGLSTSKKKMMSSSSVSNSSKSGPSFMKVMNTKANRIKLARSSGSMKAMDEHLVFPLSVEIPE